MSLAAMEAELQAEGSRDLRPHRGHLQEAAPSCRTSSSSSRSRGETGSTQQQKALRQAARRDHRRGEERSRSTTTASRAWSSSSTASTSKLVGLEGQLMRLAETYGVPRAGLHRRVLRQRARPDLARPRQRADGARLGARSSSTRRARIEQLRAEIHDARRRDGPRDRRVPPHRQGTCRRASARPARPRRRWSRPTCAS